MTIAEIIAFLPNSINCADVIYRMVSNGGTRKTIHAIFNTFRDFEAEWSVNCCGETMYKVMDKAGYFNWTISKHGLWHDSRKSSWDANRLDVGELRVTSLGVPGGTVSFKSLAKNVRAMPEGDDALDLTRMIRYCVLKSEDGWEYPKDYNELLGLLGGPAEVREQNTDGAVFRRWEMKRAQPPTPRPAPPLAGVELLSSLRSTRRRVGGLNKRSTAEGRSRSGSPGPGSLMRRRAAREHVRATSETAVDAETMDGLELNERAGTPYERGLVSKVAAASLSKM